MAETDGEELETPGIGSSCGIEELKNWKECTARRYRLYITGIESIECVPRSLLPSSSVTRRNSSAAPIQHQMKIAKPEHFVLDVTAASPTSTTSVLGMTHSIEKERPRDVNCKRERLRLDTQNNKVEKNFFNGWISGAAGFRSSSYLHGQKRPPPLLYIYALVMCNAEGRKYVRRSLL